MVFDLFKKKKVLRSVVKQKKIKKPLKKKKMKEVIAGETSTEETVLETKKTGVPPKEVKKAFRSQEDIEGYYSDERQKIEESLKALEVKKVKAYVDVARKDFTEVQLKKKKLQELHEEIQSHVKNLSNKAVDLKKKKEREKESLAKVNSLLDAVKILEDEAKGIQQTRKDLIVKEKRILSQIKKTVSDDKDDFALIDQQDAVKLQELENSKEYVLAEATHLLSKDMGMITTDQAIIEKLTEKAKQAILSVNRQLVDINKKKRELLEKEQLLELDEEKVQKELGGLREKKDKLEGKLSNLVHGGSRKDDEVE